MVPRSPPIDYAALIPELATYLDGEPGTVEMWLNWIGRYDAAVAYASLFWPEFVEVDGCVLLGPGVPESYAEWKASHPGDPSAIEATLNHLHLGDLFSQAPRPNAAVLLHLGCLLRETWSAKLARDFPDRAFVVEFQDDFHPEHDDPQITFHTRRATD